MRTVQRSGEGGGRAVWQNCTKSDTSGTGTNGTDEGREARPSTPAPVPLPLVFSLHFFSLDQDAFRKTQWRERASNAQAHTLDKECGR